MPQITTDDGVRLYYEETGDGTPLVFVHEFGGDHRSFEPQLRFFARHYRCIAFNARGYPPSDVPERVAQYSQERARDDIRAVLDALGLQQAHVVGVSMGAAATLQFGLAYPDRALSLVIAGGGAGSNPDAQAQFRKDALAMAELIEAKGMAEFARLHAMNGTRIQYRNKDPRGWFEFERMLSEHSAEGSARTMRGVQARRRGIFEYAAEMSGLMVPALIVVGDEDEPCLEPSLFMKRAIATAALAVLPRTGHAVNLEEPALFNQLCADFLHRVETGRWPPRDPRAVPGKSIGIR